MSDHRRKQALDEGTDGVTEIMPETPMLAVVRSTIWLDMGNAVYPLLFR
ncbi:MAG: hypothetical protein JNN07_24150 [Verrucomicrobiales bacterium]|nr:hypothetical protein [Verrucomicrobiales bacterium]